MCNLFFNQWFCQTLPWILLFVLIVFLVNFIHYTFFGESVFKTLTSGRVRHVNTMLWRGGYWKVCWMVEIILLSVLPIVFIFSGARIEDTVINKITADLNFAAISIALATYVATVRLYLIGRLGQAPRPSSPKLIKATIVTMIPADFNLILSAVIIVMNYFINPIADYFVNFAAVAFLYAVTYLAAQHLIAWIVSFYKLIGY